MHAPGDGKEDAMNRLYDRIFIQYPLQARLVRRERMRALDDLWQLGWIPDQDEVSCGI